MARQLMLDQWGQFRMVKTIHSSTVNGRCPNDHTGKTIRLLNQMQQIMRSQVVGPRKRWILIVSVYPTSTHDYSASMMSKVHIAIAHQVSAASVHSVVQQNLNNLAISSNLDKWKIVVLGTTHQQEWVGCLKHFGMVRWLLDRNNTLPVYKTLILPVIDYCDYIYLGTSAHNRDTLQKMQNCAFRSILGVDNRAHTKDTHESLNMDMLDSRREKHAAVQVFKFVNQLGPDSCNDLFTLTQDHHSVNTRSSVNNGIMIPRMNLSLCQRNIRYLGAKIWAKIPDEIKSAPNLETFKSSIYELNW